MHHINPLELNIENDDQNAHFNTSQVAQREIREMNEEDIEHE